MADFTPGPWKVSQPHQGRFPAIGVRSDSGSRDVADVWGNTQASAAEVHANACLIAAAPEMYQALTFVKDWFQHLDNSTEDNDPLKAIRAHFHAPLHRVIDAALATAEGREAANG